MVWPCGGKTFVERARIKIMPLRGQLCRKIGAGQHNALMGAIGFIAGKQIHIHAKGGKIGQAMRGKGHPIHNRARAMPPRQRRNFCHIVDLRNHIAAMGKGHQLCPTIGQQRAQIIQV